MKVCSLFETEVAGFDVDIFVLGDNGVWVAYVDAHCGVDVAAVYVCRV